MVGYQRMYFLTSLPSASSSPSSSKRGRPLLLSSLLLLLFKAFGYFSVLLLLLKLFRHSGGRNRFSVGGINDRLLPIVFVSSFSVGYENGPARHLHFTLNSPTHLFLSSIKNNNNNDGGGDNSNSKNWRSNLPRDVYASTLLWKSHDEFISFMETFDFDATGDGNDNNYKFSNSRNDNDDDDNGWDHLWEQVKLEALSALSSEPEAGPQLYQSILSQGSLVEAIVSIIAHEVETELIKATEIKKLFLDTLTEEDKVAIHCDVIASAYRSPSVAIAVLAILYQTGLHALVCYRVGHRLWNADRTGLAKYLQSVISNQYSSDIHPACSMGQGVYLSTTAGVVIGETATVGNDVSILHGVTLGGTGKDVGDRHPKVEHGVVLKDCATILGNIQIGTGSLVMAKSIVTKPVPPLSIMRGVPAKIIGQRMLNKEDFHDDLEEHLAFKYLDEWMLLI